MPPEIRLLLCGSRSRMDDGKRFEALAAEVDDWGLVVRLARRNAVAPLLYENLRAHGAGRVPAAVLSELRAFFHANATRNRLLAEELLRLLHLFEAHQIPAIPYKGPSLAVTAYGDLRLRQFGDLDILIPEADVLRARDLLLAHGYRPQRHPEPGRQARYLRDNKDFKFYSKDRRCFVELHWRLALRRLSFPFDAAMLWETGASFSLSGMTVPALAPENLVIVLCANGCKDRWKLLSRVCDVAEVVRAFPAMDWDTVVARAETYRGRRMLHLGLFLAHTLLEAPVPDHIAQRAGADPVVAALGARVRRWLFSRDGDVPLWGLQKAVFTLQTREVWWDSVPYLFHLLREMTSVSEKDRAVIRLPGALSFLYLLIRPLRLLWKYGQSLRTPRRDAPG